MLQSEQPQISPIIDENENLPRNNNIAPVITQRLIIKSSGRYHDNKFKASSNKSHNIRITIRFYVIYIEALIIHLPCSLFSASFLHLPIFSDEKS